MRRPPRDPPRTFSHPDATQYISVVVLRTKYTKQRLNDFNVCAYSRSGPQKRFLGPQKHFRLRFLRKIFLYFYIIELCG